MKIGGFLGRVPIDEDVQECFLCNPRQDLVYASVDNAFALCGLGPLGPAYSVIATKAHVRSAADACSRSPGFLDFVNKVRFTLHGSYGSSVLTEHGRVAVCIGPSGAPDPHCFHAHYLLFPGVPDIEEAAKRHFANHRFASTLADAMGIAAAMPEEYFLVSGSTNSFQVMTRPGKLVRQFARWLIADALRIPEKANWHKFPDEQAAISTAQQLRELF